MIRRSQTLGILIAMLAVSAMTASAAQADFTSSSYPATATGTSSSDVLDAFGSTVRCTQNHFEGTLTAASTTLTVHPTFAGCEAFGLPMTVNTTSCDFLFHKNAGVAGTVDVACTTPGDAIDITVYSNSTHATSLCHMRIPAQTGKSGYILTNSSPSVVISGSITGLSATQTRTSILCPSGESTTTAAYTIQSGGITMSSAGNTLLVD